MRMKRTTIWIAFVLQLVTVLYMLNFRPAHLPEQQSTTRKELFILPPLSQADRDNSVLKKLNRTARANTTFLFEPITEGKFNCRGSCATKDEIRWQMVLFVKSAFGNIEKRKKIRETWGSIRQVNGASLKTVFVVGKSNSSNVNLKLELSIHGDILQYKGLDDYSHIATKTLAGMQWAAENLPEHHLFSSVDDDMFIDMKPFVDGIDHQFIKQKKDNWPEFPIFCGFVKGVDEKPVRKGETKFQKWAISREIYRWPTYPPYCHGGLYVTSVRVIKQLYNLSRYRKIWFLDDVWLTGLLHRELGMPDEMVTDDECPSSFHLSSNPEDNWKWDLCKKKSREELELLLDDESFCRCS